MELPRFISPEKEVPVGIQAQPVQTRKAFDDAQVEFDEIKADLTSAEAQGWSHADAERHIWERGLELMRRLFQGFIDAQGSGLVAGPVVDVDGLELTYHRERSRGLGSIFGDVRVDRMGYYTSGSGTLCPLDATLNLPPELYSLETQRRAALEVARGPFNAAVEAMARTTGTRVPKRQIEELTVRSATDFEGFYEQRKLAEDAAKGELLVLSADGKGVVVLVDDLRAETRAAALERVQTLEDTFQKKQRRNAKRMATAATVYTVDRFRRTPEDFVAELRRQSPGSRSRPRPCGKTAWASLVKEPEQVITEAFEEAHRRDPRKEKPWVVVVDGNNVQLELIKKCARRFKVDVTIVLDIMHVLNYLWDAARELTAGGEHAEQWVAERALRILNGEAGLVAGGIRRSATKRGRAPESRKKVDDCARYLTNHLPFLRYDLYLREGFPIASGAIEGSCRYLINDRLDVTGAIWSVRRAEAVLKLRALLGNGDFEAYWSHHERREHARNHGARYSGDPPATIPPKRRSGHLRLVHSVQP